MSTYVTLLFLALLPYELAPLFIIYGRFWTVSFITMMGTVFTFSDFGGVKAAHSCSDAWLAFSSTLPHELSQKAIQHCG